MRFASFGEQHGTAVSRAVRFNGILVSNRRRITVMNALGTARSTSLDEAQESRADDLASATIAEHARKSARDSSGGRSKQDSPEGLLSDKELASIERRYADGMTAVQIVEVFAARGVKFSEATFRKYVQQGLLPRSRRVGRKGKHRGSLGVYPAKAVGRINLIKKLMLDGYTIEEIQSQFLQFTDVLEGLAESLDEAFELFESELESSRFDSKARKSLGKDMADARKCADEILERMNGLSQRLSQSREDSYRSTGAAGSAEDLL